jgi:hypothetical protein
VVDRSDDFHCTYGLGNFAGRRLFTCTSDLGAI